MKMELAVSAPAAGTVRGRARRRRATWWHGGQALVELDEP